MIHYYSYYSVGGYKDMYLGNQSMTECECTYYLPLLPVMENQAKEKNDATLNSKIAELRKLTQIRIATADDDIGLPDIATSITTKGCYKLIYTHLEGDKYAIILHDVDNGSLDNAGRQIPFLIMLMCDSKSDLTVMDKLAMYMAANTKTLSKSLGKFFTYDAQVNGLRFELAGMNAWVDKILNKDVELLLHANGKPLDIHGKEGTIALLLSRYGITAKEALSVLDVKKAVGIAISQAEYQPHDDKHLAQQNVETWEAGQRGDILKYLAIGGTCIVAALIAFCLSRCTK